jgi:hypothetical protein
MRSSALSWRCLHAGIGNVGCDASDGMPVGDSESDQFWRARRSKQLCP